MVTTLTQKKIMYMPNRRRSITSPTIFQSCEFLLSRKCLSIWRRMDLRSLRSFLTSSSIGSCGVLSASNSSEVLWRSLEEMMLVLPAVRNKGGSQTVISQLLLLFVVKQNSSFVWWSSGLQCVGSSTFWKLDKKYQE